MVKDPDAVLDFGVDWKALTNGTGKSDWLAEGETITASSWDVPAGITQATPAPSFTDTVTTIWLSGGTVGTSYTLTNHVTTSQGREDERSFTILIEDR